MLSILGQIPMPSETDNPWLWVSFLFAVGGAWVARELIHSLRAESAEWKATAKTAVAELANNTTALGKNTDALEHLGSSVERLGSVVERNAERMARLEQIRERGDGAPRGP